MTITMKSRKPRNPLVAAARFRLAGAHRSERRMGRQQGERALQRELDRLKQSP